MTTRRSIPRVPKSLPPEQRRFLEAIRETVQVQADKGRGDPKDAAITWRDWEKVNGKSLSIKRLIQGDLLDSDELYGDPAPTQPTGVEVLPTFESVLCTWDRVPNEWYASTQVFRAVWAPDTAKPSFASPGTVQVGSPATPFFTDFLPPGTRAVYWIRHVNRDNQAGPTHDIDGTEVTLYRRPADVLAEYSKEIYQGENYQWLRSSVGMLDAINRAYQLAGLSDSSPLFGALSNAASVDDLLAEQALASSLEKQSSKWKIQAQIAKNYARLSGGVHAAINLDEAYVNRIQTLEANWDGLDGTINAKLTEFETALTSPEGAIATKINEQRVTYKGSEVTLTELSAAVASANDNFAAQWGVKTDVNGLLGGVGFYNDGQQTSFVVDAQRFAVTGGDGGEVFPLVVADGKVVMDAALMETAEIYNLIAKNVTVEKLAASIEIKSPAIDGGSIVGTTLNINDKFTVNTSGFMKALNADIKGKVTATSGTLDNVTVNENCTIKGTLKATNIEGDVVDRIIAVITSEYKVASFGSAVLMSINIVPGIVGPTSDRTVVVSGLHLSSVNTAPAGDSRYSDIIFYVDGVEKQRTALGGNSTLSNIQFSAKLPAGSTNHSVSIEIQSGDRSEVTVHKSSAVFSIYKAGSSVSDPIAGTSGFYVTGDIEFI